MIISTRNMTPTFAKRQSNPPYEIIAEHRIRNQFNLTIRNQYFQPISVEISLTQEAIHQGIRMIMPIKTLPISEGTQEVYSCFIEFPKTLLKNGSVSLPLIQSIITKRHLQEQHPIEVTLSGPLS